MYSLRTMLVNYMLLLVLLQQMLLLLLLLIQNHTLICTLLNSKFMKIYCKNLRLRCWMLLWVKVIRVLYWRWNRRTWKRLIEWLIWCYYMLLLLLGKVSLIIGVQLLVIINHILRRECWYCIVIRLKLWLLARVHHW